MKIAIIGSGPSGAVAAQVLANFNFQVELVDIGSENENPKTKSNSNLKEINGKNFPYDLQEFNKFLGYEKFEWSTSKNRGGFSLVWGATWKRFRKLNNESWEQSYIEVEKIIKENNNSKFDFSKASELCDCSPLKFNKVTKVLNSKRKLPIDDPTMAINRNSCDGSGNCYLGCVNNAIWSTLDILNLLSKRSNFKYVPNIFVRKIELVSDGVRLIHDNGELHYDHVIIACGPVASTILLMKSELINNVTHLMDTNLIQIPFISLKKIKTSKSKYNLTHATIEIPTNNGKNSSHLQLYSHLEQNLEKVLGELPKVFSIIGKSIIPKFLKRVLIGFLYLDKEYSSCLKFESKFQEIEISEVINRGKLKYFLTIMYVLIRNIWNFGLIPFPLFTKFTSTGSSYHVGSIDSELFDEFGIHKRIGSISIAGALNLDHLEAGPITFTSMAQSHRLATKLASVLTTSQ